LFLMISATIHIGKTSMAAAIINPMGFHQSASVNRAWNTEITDLLIPHDGQCRPVILLKTQVFKLPSLPGFPV